MYNKKADLSHMKIISCLYYAINFVKVDKFRARAIKSVPMGYGNS